MSLTCFLMDKHLTRSNLQRKGLVLVCTLRTYSLQGRKREAAGSRDECRFSAGFLLSVAGHDPSIGDVSAHSGQVLSPPLTVIKMILQVMLRGSSPGSHPVDG